MKNGRDVIPSKMGGGMFYFARCLYNNADFKRVFSGPHRGAGSIFNSFSNIAVVQLCLQKLSVPYAFLAIPKKF